MTRLPWLERYTGQTIDELLALEGVFRTDSLIVAILEGLFEKIGRDGPESLSEEEEVVLAVEALQAEVNNGGYSLFFFNRSVVHAPSIVGALRAIECPIAASITQEAIDAIRPSELSVAAIDERIDEEDPQREELHNKLTFRFYKESEFLEEKVFAFIKARRSSFRL